MKTTILFIAIYATLCVRTAMVFGHVSDNKTAEARSDQEVFSTTTHTVKAGGKQIEYTTTAGRLILKSEAGESRAQIFFIAYEKKGTDSARRPVTFAFNGGPGSSSVWLHLGAIGPKRISLNKDGSVPPPPAVLVDNEFTWLEFTDVVFIDPVGTGYSRAVDEKKEKEFYNFKNDIEAVGDFMRLYLTRYNRWQSPKFVAGESYGTTRAVGLIGYIHQKHGIDLNGILLISPVLDFNTIDFSQSNDLPYLLFLPTYTASAWYHKKLASPSPDLESSLAPVETWALNEYTTILAQGTALTPEKQEAAAGMIGGLTGLSSEYVLKNNLRVHYARFCKELLRDRQIIIGRMDARMTMPDTDGAGDVAESDPSFERLIGAFAGTINQYVKNDLKFTEDIPYTYLNYNAGKQWDWKSGIQREQGYLSLSQSLTDAMHLNGHLKVFIASGYYDLATPYCGAKYTVNHLVLENNLKDNIHINFYHAGHMMYTDQPSLGKLFKDVSAFYKER